MTEINRIPGLEKLLDVVASGIGQRGRPPVGFLEG